MLATADMSETISLYQSVLVANHAIRGVALILERDGQTIHFQEAESEEVMKCVRGTHTEIYIESLMRRFMLYGSTCKASGTDYSVRD